MKIYNSCKYYEEERGRNGFLIVTKMFLFSF